jgi:hypothetical protein
MKEEGKIIYSRSEPKGWMLNTEEWSTIF